MNKSIEWTNTVLGMSLLLVAGLSLFGQGIDIEIADKPFPVLSIAGKEDPSIEVSAVIALDGSGKTLLAVDDENPKLLVIDSATGKVVGEIGLHGINKPKPKWEGLAKDDEGAFYVIGGHSVKPDEVDPAKLRARSRLFRFFVVRNADGQYEVDGPRTREWSVVDSLRSEEQIENPGKAKIKTEGLAVRTRYGADGKPAGRELLVGLREPGDPVRVMSADITQLPSDGAKLTMRRLFSFSGGSISGTGLRLSSLEYSPEHKGFFVLGSTEDSAGNFHGNMLWFVPDRGPAVDLKGVPVTPQPIWKFGISIKAEGLCLFGGAGDGKTVRAIVAYDNDGKAPSMLQQIVIAVWENK